MSHGIRRMKEVKRFIYYSLYAWGFPCLATFVCFMMDSSYDIIPSHFKPHIGESSCWFGKYNKTKKVSSFFHSKFMNVDCIFCQKTVRQDTLFSFWSRWGYKSPWTSYCSSLQLFTVTASSRKFTGCKWTIIASRKRSATLLTRPCELNVSVMDDTKKIYVSFTELLHATSAEFSWL